MEREQEREKRIINTKIIIENTLQSEGINLNNLENLENLENQEKLEKLENFTLLDYINMTSDKIVKK
jgi:hypothetical protein